MKRALPVVLLALIAAMFAYAAVPGAGGLQRVAVDARTLTTIKLGDDDGESIMALAYGERALWAALSGRRVQRVDPGTGDAAPVPGSSGALDVAAGEGAVWAFMDGRGIDEDAGQRNSLLLRIDPGRLEVTDRVQLGATALQVVTGGGRVWVRLHDAIAEIDPASGRVLRRLGAAHAEAILSTRAALWKISYTRIIERPGPDRTMRSETPTVAKLDAQTGKVLARVPLDGGADELGVDGGDIVAHGRGSASAYRIDADGRRARDTGLADFCAAHCRARGLAGDASQTWIVGVREDRDTNAIEGYLRRPSQPERLLTWRGAALRGCCAEGALGDGAVFVAGSGTTISRIELP